MILNESPKVTRILVPNPLPQKMFEVSKHKKETKLSPHSSHMEVP